MAAMNKAAYNRIAAELDSARVSFWGRERVYVDALIDGLPERSSILDLGCGTGRSIAEYLLSRGHRVTGVDQASELLALARARFPQASPGWRTLRSRSATTRSWLSARSERA